MSLKDLSRISGARARNPCMTGVAVRRYTDAPRTPLYYFIGPNVKRLLIGKKSGKWRRKNVRTPMNRIYFIKRTNKSDSGALGHLFFVEVSLVDNIPANTKHWTNAGSMLARRLRRRPNIEPTLVQCLLHPIPSCALKPQLFADYYSERCHVKDGLTVTDPTRWLCWHDHWSGREHFTRLCSFGIHYNRA